MKREYNSQRNNQHNNQHNNQQRNVSINKFVSIPPLPTKTAMNAIAYANDVLLRDKIQDLPMCNNVYDDNIGVRQIGYRDCNSAYADYLSKNLDTSQLYGMSKSLTELCPVTTNSPLYLQCMTSLLNKFNTNSSIFQSVNKDMTDSINQRLTDRTNIMNNIDLTMNPYIYNKDITEFKAQTNFPDIAKQGADELLYKAKMYYQNKYGLGSLGTSSGSSVEGFTSGNRIVVDPYNVSNFFTDYVSIKGQFLAFDNLEVSLQFQPPSATMSFQESEPTIPITTAFEIPESTILATSKNTGVAQLVINDKNTNAQIIYAVSAVHTYESTKNAIVLTISSQRFNTVAGTNVTALQQLLSTLGFAPPCKVIIMIDQNVSDTGVKRFTYKLTNMSNDTIMIMKKKDDS